MGWVGGLPSRQPGRATRPGRFSPPWSGAGSSCWAEASRTRSGSVGAGMMGGGRHSSGVSSACARSDVRPRAISCGGRLTPGLHDHRRRRGQTKRGCWRRWFRTRSTCTAGGTSSHIARPRPRSYEASWRLSAAQRIDQCDEHLDRLHASASANRARSSGGVIGGPSLLSRRPSWLVRHAARSPAESLGPAGARAIGFDTDRSDERCSSRQVPDSSSRRGVARSDGLQARSRTNEPSHNCTCDSATPH